MAVLALSFVATKLRRRDHACTADHTRFAFDRMPLDSRQAPCLPCCDRRSRKHGFLEPDGHYRELSNTTSIRHRTKRCDRLLGNSKLEKHVHGVRLSPTPFVRDPKPRCVYKSRRDADVLTPPGFEFFHCEQNRIDFDFCQ
jgi:hypothetical protein